MCIISGLVWPSSPLLVELSAPKSVPVLRAPYHLAYELRTRMVYGEARVYDFSLSTQEIHPGYGYSRWYNGKRRLKATRSCLGYACTALGIEPIVTRHAYSETPSEISLTPDQLFQDLIPSTHQLLSAQCCFPKRLTPEPIEASS